jgi:hypothetical protein
MTMKRRPQTAPASSSPRRIDYVKMNKVAIDSGLVTAREQKALRETTVFYRPATGKPSAKQSIDRAQQIVHGVPTAFVSSFVVHMCHSCAGSERISCR